MNWQPIFLNQATSIYFSLYDYFIIQIFDESYFLWTKQVENIIDNIIYCVINICVKIGVYVYFLKVKWGRHFVRKLIDLFHIIQVAVGHVMKQFPSTVRSATTWSMASLEKRIFYSKTIPNLNLMKMYPVAI